MFLTKSEIDLHLDIAQRVSRESNIEKAKVGCVNLYANGMVSLGWNQLLILLGTYLLALT